MANLTTQILDKVAAPSRGVAQNHLGTPVSGPAGPIENLRAAPNLASPQDPEVFLGSPPSEFSSSPLPSANEPSQTLQNHDPDAKIPGISGGLQLPTQPLRPPRAQNPVSKALPSHSDPTCVASG